MRKVALAALLALFKDTRGQATTEYILILAMVIGLFMAFKSSIVGLLSSLNGKLSAYIDTFLGGDLHHLQWNGQ